MKLKKVVGSARIFSTFCSFLATYSLHRELIFTFPFKQSDASYPGPVFDEESIGDKIFYLKSSEHRKNRIFCRILAVKGTKWPAR